MKNWREGEGKSLKDQEPRKERKSGKLGKILQKSTEEADLATRKVHGE